MTEKFLDEITGALPADRYELGDIPAYRYSVSLTGEEAILGVVYPESAEEVSAVMRAATRHGVPVSPISGGTSYSGAVVPRSGGLVLDMGRMDKVLEVDTDNLVATVQPGIVLKTLDRALAAHGVTLGHEPDSWFASTLGGACSTNGVGHRSTVELLAEQVLGLEAVLPDGTVVETRPVWKSSTGKDTINHLFLGMEGAYGVLTRLHLRLRRLPEREEVVLYGFPDFKDACRAAWELTRSGINPIGLYVLDGPRARALVGPLPGDPDGVLVAYLGGVDGVVEAQRQALAALCAGGTHLESMGDRWLLKRHYYVRAGRRQGGSVTGTLTSFPRFSDFMTMFDRFRALCDEYGFAETYVGAMLYFGRSWMAVSMLVGVDAHDPEVMKRHARWQAAVLDTQLELGGTADAVTSVGFWRARYMATEHGNGHELLRLLKRTLDPGQVLNRGIRALG